MFHRVADDPKIGQFYKAGPGRRILYATCDAYAYSKADIVIVDINLDVKRRQAEMATCEDYTVDLAPFKSHTAASVAIVSPCAGIG